MNVNKYGFPMVTCRRCAGTGAHGPSSVVGGRCFDCGGQGVHVRRGSASKAWSAFIKAVREFHTPTGATLQVGDRIRVNKGDELRTIAALDWKLETGRSAGGSTMGVVGSGDDWVTSSRLPITITITFTDGSTATTGTNHLIASRAGRVDPAPFLATIR